jgi:hypothetical protein
MNPTSSTLCAVLTLTLACGGGKACPATDASASSVSIYVTVLDDATGTAVCNASVDTQMLRGGSPPGGAMALPTSCPPPHGTSCEYCLVTGPGSFQVQVTDGATLGPALQNVTVGGDSCGIVESPVHVTLRLPPYTPPGG